MSRINTQPDYDPFANKLAIIASNMARINCQNKRLQELLNHQMHLDRLRQISDQSAQNWHKLANLAQNVQDLSVKAKTSRQKIHNSLSKHTETLNKTLLAEVKNARSSLANFQSRLNHLQNKQTNILANQLQKQKHVALERIQEKMSQFFAFLTKLGQKYQQQTVLRLSQLIESGKQDMRQNYIECRISLGHLHNIIAYRHWKKKSECISIQKASKISFESVRHINDKLKGIQFNLKRIKGEVDWMKARQKKNKTVLVKQQRKTNQQYQPMQQMRTQQVGMSIQEVQYQLKGLQRIFDFQTIAKNIKYEDINLQELNKAKYRIKKLREQHQIYANFYKLKL